MLALEQVLSQGPYSAKPWILVPYSARIEQVPLLVCLALFVLQDKNLARGKAL
jgi:hypothetical protein